MLLDTNVLLRLRSGDALIGTKTRELLHLLAKQNELAVSAVSFHEVSRLCRDGSVNLDISIFDWCQRCMASGIVAIPLGWEIAAASPLLADVGFHGDPFDQTIVATAIRMGIPLVTTDRAIIDWARSSGKLEALDARR